MVYTQVIVAAAVAALLAEARRTPSAAGRGTEYDKTRDIRTHSEDVWPTASEHLLPENNTDLMFVDRVASDTENPVVVHEDARVCEEHSGECIKKKNINKCDGKIEKNYICEGKKKVCCMKDAPPTPAPTTLTPVPATPDAIESMIVELLVLIKKQEEEIFSLKTHMEHYDEIMEHYQETILSNVNNINTKINNQNTFLFNMKEEIYQVENNQEALLDNVNQVQIELDEAQNNQEAILDNVDQVQIDLDNVQNNQEALLDNVNQVQIELDEAQNNQEVLLDNVNQVQIELDETQKNQEALLDNVNQVQIELEEAQNNQEALLDNVNQVQIELEEAQNNQEQLITDVKTEIGNVEEKVDEIKEILDSDCPAGFIDLGPGDCFQYFNDQKVSWSQAQTRCSGLGMYLAEPSDQVVSKLQEKIVNTGDAYVWLGAKANGTAWVWQRSQTQLSEDNPAWRPGWDTKPVVGQCLMLSTYGGHWNDHPGQPYVYGTCSNAIRYTLCQKYYY